MYQYGTPWPVGGLVESPRPMGPPCRVSVGIPTCSNFHDVTPAVRRLAIPSSSVSSLRVSLPENTIDS